MTLAIRTVINLPTLSTICRFDTAKPASIKSHTGEQVSICPKHLQILKLLEICWSAHSTGNTAMRYRNQWLLQCERIHYYSVSARLQNDLFYDQRLAIPCKPKYFAPRPALMPLKFSPSWYLCPVHALSFRHDIVGEYQITPRRNLSPMAQTSSDPEVVVNLLVRAFDGEHGDEIRHHIATTAKSV